MSWSDAQLRILRALGHEPMRLAGAQAAGAPAVHGGEAERVEAAVAGVVDFGMLEAAIARAAGGRDLAALALDLGRLRREPAQKRELWAKLRQLRRGH